MKKTFAQLLPLVLLVLVTRTAVLAQNSQAVVANGPISTVPSHTVSQTVLNSLSSLPDADTLIYVNPQRILNEAVPRLAPEKALAEMRGVLSQVKQFAGVDPSKLDYIVIAVRVRKPSAELKLMPPEFMVVARGNFSADSILVLARMASSGKLREESYGTKRLGLLTIDPIVREAEKKPFLKAFSEIAIVPLSANTIAVGTPAYLKAAVDASEGQGRINPDTLNSLVRDTNALVSMAGTPWYSFAKSFGLLGTEANTREVGRESKIGNFYVGLAMDATNFLLRGVMNADNPDTAKIINNLLTSLLQQATSAVPDKTAQLALKLLSITSEDSDLVLRADIPQQMILDLIKEQMKPEQQAQPATGTSKDPPQKPATRRRKRVKH